MKRYRSRLFLLSVVACLTACATARVPEGKPPSQATGIPPPPLVPQPEGTPLPPRDPRIAERWPPDIKRLVDNMLTLYPKTPEERPPTVEEVEQKMGITLVERTLVDDDSRLWQRRFDVSEVSGIAPSSQRLGFYEIFQTRPRNAMRQRLQMVTSPKHTGFCLDPYELAVYTGSNFINGDSSPHFGVRSWPPAYVWGMFEWSNANRYIGQRFTVVLDQVHDPVTQKLTNTGCVGAIAVFSRYGEERK